MTIHQDSTETVVRIRPAGPLWIAFCGLGAAIIAAAAMPGGGPWLTLLELVLGAFNLAVGVALRIFGLDLTPEFAVVRNLRRRRIPWVEVAAVVSQSDSREASLSLIFEKDEPLILAYPPAGRKGNAQCARDFQRVNEWWLGHRGDSWRPVRP